MVNPSKVIDAAFFAERSKLNQETGCLEWTRHVNQNGYGTVKHKRKTYPAHRFAWIQKYGPVPDGMVICHKCDNRKCINVDHLFIGTTLDNVRDKINKGRLRVAEGEQSGTSKLTAKQIEQIVLDSRPQTLIAKDHGVSQATISLVKQRKNWRSVSANSPPDKKLTVREFAALWDVPYENLRYRIQKPYLSVCESLRRLGATI